jgi:2-oxoisovalerate dehydrogenase E2 component (dihydrolipoyl transacylase)
VQDFIDQGSAPDVETAAAAARPDAGAAAGRADERLPLTPIRRMIADHMVRSATEIPQAWTLVEVNASALVQRRQAVRSEFEERERVGLTYLPFVIKAVAEGLKDNVLLNSSWSGDSITLKKRINIGLAMATPEGLVVPVIHDADTLSIAALAHRVDDLTSRSRGGQLRLEDVQGGTFTLNNTGVLGSVASQPLVNHPQAAILTTEAIVKRAVVIDDAIAIRPIMNLCLSFDHRIMDGAEASAFINGVKHWLETIDADSSVY